MKECCANCRRCYRLKRSEYSINGGCKDTFMEGYACSVFAGDGVITWCVGLDSENDLCECFMEKDEATRNMKS